MALDIYEQYEKVYRYCYYKVKNAALAEDLTQETFLRFFSHPSYSKSNKQLAFLYVIARNLCTDTFRQRSRMQENNALSHLEPMGIFLYAAAIYPKKCLDFFVYNSCALHWDRPNFSRWCLLENRCPFAIFCFDFRNRTGEIFSL